MIFNIIADLENSAGEKSNRADQCLRTLFAEEEGLSHLSRSQIQKLIETGAILANGRPLRSSDRIASGTEIQITLPEPVALDVLPENIPLQILHEDEHLIVINKQPGLSVHPSGNQMTGTLVNALLYHVKDLSGIGGKLRPGIVHRIDKDTSGALVVSKNDATHHGLAKLFAAHTLERCYWALTYGVPKIEASLRMETTIDRNPVDRKKMAVNIEGGRIAISHFRKIQEFGVKNRTPFAAWIEATLETGRTHQIRVHLTHLGHSIMGDPVYGTPSDSQAKWKNLPTPVQTAVRAMPGQALHARVLGFTHPITGERLHFEAEPYPDFSNLLDTLKKFS